MPKPARIRDGGSDTEREPKKKRNLPPSSSAEVGPPMCEPDDLQHALPSGVGERPYDVVEEDEEEAKKQRNVLPSSSGDVVPPMCEPYDLQHSLPAGGGDAVEEGEEEAKKKKILLPSSSGEVGPPMCEPEEMIGVGVEGDEDELSSFTPKSPIKRPYIPDELSDSNAYPEILGAFKEARVKYEEKLARRGHLFTLAHKANLAPSCLFHHEHLHPIRETAKNAVLHAAKSVIKLSSSVDGKPLAKSCGLLIRWHEESKTGIILTTAHLIRSKHPTVNHWEGKDEYNPHANVIVHLLDDTTAQGQYLYHQGHYELALFKVRLDEPVQPASLCASVNSGQDVFRLGRDDHMDLRITHGRVDWWNPGGDQRHHYMYLSHQEDDHLLHQNDNHLLIDPNNDEYLCDDDGGSIINLDGKVVGLVNNHLNKGFVPSCILDKCIGLWTEFGCIPRLHLGMKFTSIKLLDPINIDKMWRLYKIQNGLIIEEVSQGSHAEKLGICRGDIIERFNGECISSAIELENMLLGRCWEHFDKGNHLNTNIDVSIQVFHTEERLRRTVNLSVAVSDGAEIVTRRTYPITATEGRMYASLHPSQNVAGDPLLPKPALTWEELAGRLYNEQHGGKLEYRGSECLNLYHY